MPAPGELRRDRTGERCGRLVVLAFAGRNRWRSALWLCRCDCGAEVTVVGDNLDGNTSSCGCRRTEVTIATSTTHGHGAAGARSPEYQSWTSMLARVRATTGRRYQDYGARGITVCDRWLVFENFLADMGPRPAGTSIDRINNDGNYEPSNCRWATDSQQVANRRFLGRKSHSVPAGATSSNSGRARKRRA